VLSPRALGLAAVAAALGSSFLLYPDIIFGEPAVLQSAPSLLEPARAWPLWLVGAALAFVPPGPLDRFEVRRARGLMPVAVGAAVSLLIPPGLAGQWHYALAGGLCALAVAPGCVRL
jgi:hypothetical protein